MATRDPVGKKRQGGECLSATGVVIVALYILGELGLKEPPANVVAAATGILVGLVGLVASWHRDRKHLKTTLTASLLLILLLPAGCAITRDGVIFGNAWTAGCDGKMSYVEGSESWTCDGDYSETYGGEISAAAAGLAGGVISGVRNTAGRALGIPGDPSSVRVELITPPALSPATEEPLP